MDRLLRNAYGEELGNSNREIDDVVQINHNGDIDVRTGGDGDIIETLDGSNHTGNFGDDEWMRQLQPQEGLMGHGEASLNSPQPNNQFRLPYDQNSPLPIPKNGAINGPRNDMDVSKQGADQIRLQESQQNQAQHMPRVHSIEGLHQLHGVDNMTALNNLLQQQQQQQQSSLPNNPNQVTAASLGTAATPQSLQQQLVTLQQQQLQPHNSQPGPQQMTTTSLHESLLQLQKLQEQQQQILKTISQNTGLVDPNSLMNPLGTLLNTLIGQLSGNTNTNDTGNTNINSNSINSNNNNMNNAMNQNPDSGSTLAWGQMGGNQQQQLQLPNNSLQNPGTMMPTMLPPIQQQQQRQKPGIVGPSNAPLEPPRPLRLPPPTRRTTEEPRKRFVSNNSLTKTSMSSGSSRNSSRNPSPNTNINIAFPTPPIIRKTESNKKQRPKSFPSQLWDAMNTHGPMNDEAFEWLPDGKSFVVVDSEFFCKEILDRKFKQSKYGSFVRKLHRWGFIRLTSGTGTDCFHHPLFQKSRPELVSKIKCNSRSAKDGGKAGHNAYARGEVHDSVQPSLMGVEKFIRAKVVSTETDDLPL